VAEQSKPAEQLRIEDKPGTGVDRTTIQGMLRLTPAERLKHLVVEANRLEELFSKMRIK
jgi:hypothetical protein